MKDYTKLLEWLDEFSETHMDALYGGKFSEAAAAIRELQKRVRKLDSLFEVASLFCRVDTCPNCKMFYPVGYICVSCGTDNSDHET